jgi:hypothetical protein
MQQNAPRAVVQTPTPAAPLEQVGAATARTDPAGAAPAIESAAPDGRASSFRAVEPGKEEQVDGGKLLLGAYAMVWLIVLVLVVRIFRRQSALAESVRALEAAVDRRAKRGGEA